MTKRSFALAASLMFAVACPGEEDPTVVPVPTPQCTTINNSFPADGAANVYYRTTLSWEFATADESASVTVADSAGTEVPGTAEWLGNVYIWTPSAPLTAAETYAATLSYCDGNQMPETSFTVGNVGAAVTAGDLVGGTYQLSLDAGPNGAQVLQPAAVGGALQSFLEDPANQVDILMGVVAADDTSIELIGALGDGGNPLMQDVCLPSIPFPSVGFTENPFFSVGPQDLTLDVLGDAFTLQDLELNGAFTPDGSGIAGAVLAGTIDVREFAPSFDLTPEGACETAATFGAPCMACDGGGDFCLDVLIANITATEVAGLTLVEVVEPSTDPTVCPPDPAE